MANTIHGIRFFGDRELLYFETTKGTYQVTVYVVDDDGTDAGGVRVISENPNIARFWGSAWGTTEPTKRGILIKPISYGRTRIRFESVTDPSKYAYLTVQVGPVVAVQGVQLSRSSVYLVKGGSGERVRASVDAPSGSTGVSVVSSKNNVASVTMSSTSDPAVTLLTIDPLNVGETVVTVRSSADSTVYAKLNVKVVESQEDVPPGGGDDGGSGGGGSTPSGGGDWTPRDARDQTPLRTTATFFEELGEDEEINDITSVGNTLIISTPKNMYYYLWKEGAYHFLGNKIPAPVIYFRMGNMEHNRTAPVAVIDTSVITTLSPEDGVVRTDEEMKVFPHENIGDTIHYGYSSKKYVFDNSFESGFWNEFLDATWGQIDKKLIEQARLGKAVFPIFVRYAVRLYDGTEYGQSIPILLGADVNKFVDVKGIVLQMFGGDDGKEKNALTIAVPFVSITDSYSIVMEVANRNMFGGWEDIVEAVDIFLSPQFAPPQRNAAQFDMELIGKELATLTASQFEVENFMLDPYYTEYNQEKMVLYYQNTYLARSFSMNEFRSLPVESVLEVDTSSDFIMSQRALKESPWSMHYTQGGNLFNYNNRLMMSNVEQNLHHGYQFLHSVGWKNDGSPVPSYRFIYHLHGDNGESVVISRDENGQGLIVPKQRAVVESSSTNYTESPVAWFAYPDSRCYRIDVYQNFGSTVMFSSFATKTFDQADVAYVFLGFGVPFQGDQYTDILPADENPVYRMPNSLVVSRPNNPFVFPAEDVVTFIAGEILNIAVASVPLSEGQAGQFPLYVFTDEGVFAMTVDAEGKLRTSHNVSRDILLSKDALVGIEQGVFFAAARGLLLLQGSRVTNVSSQMDGLPTTMDESLLGKIETLLGFQVDDQQALRSFLSDCILAYDYANTRILVANPKYNAMYVYKFDTQSWHRMQTDFGKPVRVLNAFPEAQIAMRSGQYQSLLDFSVLAENEDAEAMRGLVYTRDLDLDGADIYKVISKLKVRGRFENGHVRWQLQGSNDGINYTTIHSLHGPSWKWYRIALLTMLGKDERISYVELDYTPKFTDKIR